VKKFLFEQEKYGEIRIDKFLSLVSEFNRSKIQILIESGCVLLDGEKIIKCKQILKNSQEIEIINTEIINKKDIDYLKPYECEIEIVYQDNDILVINKQAGICVHPGIGNHDNTLVNALISKNIQLSSINGDFRPGIVHRIDKDTSGLLIVAKNDKSHEVLAEMIMKKEIIRKYKAIVFGLPVKTSDTIITKISKDRKNPTKMMVNKFLGKESITHYKVLEYFKNKDISLIECVLETGRTHQIRVHMSYIGHSVLGDQIYGNNNRKLNFRAINDPLISNFKRQALHSYYIEFAHPITCEIIKFEIDLSFDMNSILEELRNNNDIRDRD